MSIGQGAVAFTALEEDHVEVVFGPQGGWHIEPAVRAWGLPVDGLVLTYDLLDAAGASRVIAVEARLSEDRVVPLADGGWERVGDRLVLEITSAEEVVGERIITPADTYIKPAVSATRKILDLMGRTDVPVAESTVRGVNPFPRAFRRDAFSVDNFPILNERDEIQTPRVAETGQAWLARLPREAPAPVTLLETGPLTSIAAALALDPALEAKIKRIIWMGGALNVPGNIDKIIEGGQDGSADWNVYWDPEGAAQVWQTAIPLIICPLDITNHVPITPEFVKKLSRPFGLLLDDDVVFAIRTSLVSGKRSG